MNQIALVDDHSIFSESLKHLINTFEGFNTCWYAKDGKTALTSLQSLDALQPDIILLDILMPGMTGIEVAKWLFENRPGIKVIALTMEEDDASVLKMLQYGVKGYLLKSVQAEELQLALQQVVKFGHYYTPIITSNIHKQFERKVNAGNNIELSDREKELLNHLCSDMNYTEIAKRMFLSESTVDTYRARLFEKFEVKNRIGLVLKALNLGIIKL